MTRNNPTAQRTARPARRPAPTRCTAGSTPAPPPQARPAAASVLPSCRRCLGRGHLLWERRARSCGLTSIDTAAPCTSVDPGSPGPPLTPQISRRSMRCSTAPSGPSARSYACRPIAQQPGLSRGGPGRRARYAKGATRGRAPKSSPRATVTRSAPPRRPGVQLRPRPPLTQRRSEHSPAPEGSVATDKHTPQSPHELTRAR
jgi:hypothetical protein